MSTLSHIPYPTSATMATSPSTSDSSSSKSTQTMVIGLLVLLGVGALIALVIFSVSSSNPDDEDSEDDDDDEDVDSDDEENIDYCKTLEEDNKQVTFTSFHVNAAKLLCSYKFTHRRLQFPSSSANCIRHIAPGFVIQLYGCDLHSGEFWSGDGTYVWNDLTKEYLTIDTDGVSVVAAPKMASDPNGLQKFAWAGPSGIVSISRFLQKGTYDCIVPGSGGSGLVLSSSSQSVACGLTILPDA